MKKRTIFTTAIVLCLTIVSIFALSACSKRNDNFKELMQIIVSTQPNEKGIQLTEYVTGMGEFKTSVKVTDAVNDKSEIFFFSTQYKSSSTTYVGFFIDGEAETNALSFYYTLDLSSGSCECTLVASGMADTPTVIEATLDGDPVPTYSSLYPTLVSRAKDTFDYYRIYADSVVQKLSDRKFGLTDILRQPETSK